MNLENLPPLNFDTTPNVPENEEVFGALDVPPLDFSAPAETEKRQNPPGVDVEGQSITVDPAGLLRSLPFVGDWMDENIPTYATRVDVGKLFGAEDATYDDETAAALIGVGHQMSSIKRGTKQLMGIDVEEEAANEAIMNTLYRDDNYGSYAIGGAVVGALAEPIGMIVPGMKGASAYSKIAYATGIGTLFGAGDYVDEAEGETRAGNAAFGAAAGTIIGSLFSAAPKVGKWLSSKADSPEPLTTKELDSFLNSSYVESPNNAVGDALKASAGEKQALVDIINKSTGVKKALTKKQHASKQKLLNKVFRDEADMADYFKRYVNNSPDVLEKARRQAQMDEAYHIRDTLAQAAKEEDFRKAYMNVALKENVAEAVHARKIADDTLENITGVRPLETPIQAGMRRAQGGYVQQQLMESVASSVAGAVIGGAVGESPESAFIGGVLGAAGLPAARKVRQGVGSYKVYKSDKAIRNANNYVDDLELAWAKGIVNDLPPEQVLANIQKAKPDALKRLSDIENTYGRRMSVTLSKAEAQDVIDFRRSVSRYSDYALGNKAKGVVRALSSRVRELSPNAFRRLMEYEQRTKQVAANLHHSVDNFTGSLSKMIPEMRKQVDDMLLEGDFSRARELVSRNMGESSAIEFDNVVKVLDRLGREMQKEGLIPSRFDNYFPRFVKDREGLFNALGKGYRSAVEDTIAKAAKARGRKLTPSEESDVINNFIRSSYSPAMMGRKSSVKKRSIHTVPEFLKPYYHDSVSSLHSYIDNAVAELERKRFFGNAYIKNPKQQALNLDASVGKLIRENYDGLSKPEIDELTKLLTTRFGIGEVGPAKIIQDTKSILYTALLGNPLSAATQLGDVFMSVYINGITPTLRAVLPNWVTPKAIKVKDWGFINHAAEEFVSQGIPTKIMNKAFRYGGFEAVDRLGKSTLINASLIKVTKQAKRSPDRLVERYGDMFGDDIHKVIDDLNNKRLTQDVKTLLFTELSRVQPVSLSEMPEFYLKHPNGRFIYMLKTFMLRQINLAVDDAKFEWRHGRRIGAVRKLLGLSATLGIAGMTSAAVKDIMLGREVNMQPEDLPMKLVENSFKTFAMSEYVVKKFAEGKPVEAAINAYAPPITLFDGIMSSAVGGDFQRSLEKVPAGKLFSYWFMGGLDNELSRKGWGE